MKLYFSLLVATLVATGGYCGPFVAQEEITTWEQFKETYGKKYSPDEEIVRKENFLKSLKYVQENQGKHGVVLGINELSDMSENEFLVMNSASPLNLTGPIADIPESDGVDEYQQLPAHFDWREHTRFQPIEQQGSCGSCWAFATTATVEALFAFRHNKHVHLSKQELVDCSSYDYDHNYSNRRCQLGYPPDAYKYIMQHGVYEAAFYPYNGRANEMCYTRRLGNQHPKYHINNYFRLAMNTPDANIMSMLHAHGPGVVVIHGTSEVFRHYRGGIIRNLLPHSNQVNHVVALVGWGSEHGIDYWIIRNSWGTGWGEHGYGRIERHHNLVGLNNWYSYPILN